MKSIIDIEIIKIDNNGYHLIAEIMINRLNMRVVVDTGASHSVFDEERIKKFLLTEKITDTQKFSSGIGKNKFKSQELKLTEIQLGKLIIKNQAVVLIDLSHVNKTYNSIGKKEIDGILGSDILKKLNAVIDYGNKTLKLENSSKKKKLKELNNSHKTKKS
jgi:predicted aspartyl protease